jgi:glyoxylase-like metal-dependent hydrolase (beta-lactamase superfamily II)
VNWGDLQWRAIAAPGHDMGALMFHCEEERLLITGDALWEYGFGVFPGGPGTAAVATRATLEAISDDVDTVIPGHGAPSPAWIRRWSQPPSAEAFERTIAHGASCAQSDVRVCVDGSATLPLSGSITWRQCRCTQISTRAIFNSAT